MFPRSIAQVHVIMHFMLRFLYVNLWWPLKSRKLVAEQEGEIFPAS